jgi:hypothetical protein
LELPERPVGVDSRSIGPRRWWDTSQIIVTSIEGHCEGKRLPFTGIAGSR